MPRSPYTYATEIRSASIRYEGQTTITQEVYKIVTSTEEQHDQRGMTLRIVTHFADDTTNSSKAGNKQNTQIGSSNNSERKNTKHSERDTTHSVPVHPQKQRSKRS